MKPTNKKLTPRFVERLSECEIFVFGSNLQGHHGGGAARIAYERFGAKWGVGVGPTGQCYAIPTMHGGVDDIRPYANDFIAYAKMHPRNRFLLTRVGCGIAGFSDTEMAKLFVEALDIPNISIPKEWLPSMLADFTLGLSKPRHKEPAPKVIDEDSLKNLCSLHAYEIGAGINNYLPEITVRYVIGKGKFGYATFGNFFFDRAGNFFVWHTDDGWKPKHNQNAVESVFEDECNGRGYAVKHIFAGVRTPFRDSNNEWIYTGDVLNLDNEPLAGNTIALCTFGEQYAFPLDNHCLLLAEAIHNNKLTRVGTVFYQLNADDATTCLRNRAMQFNGWYDTDKDRANKAIMARYTPNFDQEFWRYSALASLDCPAFN